METLEERELRQQLNDIKHVMGTENGRRFVWRILGYCGIYKDIEGTGSEADRQIGKRRAGLYLLGIISDIAEDNVFKMMKEAKEKTKLEEQELRALEKEDSNISEPSLTMDDLV